MRGLAPHYLTGLYDSTTYKEKINHIKSYADLENILNEYREFLSHH